MSFDYKMSQKAFIDTWGEFGQPKEIYDKEECFRFLTRLNEVTGGLVIVDHFSYTNYDHISGVKLEDNYLYIYWKNYEENPPHNDMEMEVFGNSTYIYSLCNLRKLKFIEVNGHLFILFMPNVSKIKEVKKFLSIENLEMDKELLINDNKENLYTNFRFIKENKIHECVIHNLPFYSFLIQPKQKSVDVGFSKKLLLIETLRYAVDRIQKGIKLLHILNNHDYDEIHGIGNRARSVLESIVKYYCLYNGYSLPNDHYGNNLLGDLKKHLNKKGDSNFSNLLSQEIINLANKFSHDDGNVYPKTDAEKLCKDVLLIINAAFNSIREKDFQ